LNDAPSTGPTQPNLDDFSGECTWSLRFWLMIALSGAAAGLVGGALMQLLKAVEQFAWDYDSGTLLEGAAHAPAYRHLIVLLAAGLLVGLGGPLIRKIFGAPGDAEAAIWFRSGRMPMLATLVKSVHSIIAVGMGTSLGRESPIKQAGGAIANKMAQWCRLSCPDQKLLVACGVGAGMAAAYNVPVGGALFAVEVLLGSISLRVALPALLCSGVATAAAWVLLPTGPIYQVPEYPLSMQLTAWSILAGPLLGLASAPLVRAVSWAERHKPREGMAVFVAPVVVLTVLGAVSIAFPQLLGNGKDAVQLAYVDEFSVALLLLLPILKLLATSACLGCGASGGLFTPAMTIGALLGGLFGHAWDCIWPGASMGSCAVIGSCAFLAAATQGPVSALVLVLELTRHVDATMTPMLLAVVGAVLAARQLEPRSIYSVRVHPDDAGAASTLEPGPKQVA
jgi:chloride channel protein, CIC family